MSRKTALTRLRIPFQTSLSVMLRKKSTTADTTVWRSEMKLSAADPIAFPTSFSVSHTQRTMILKALGTAFSPSHVHFTVFTTPLATRPGSFTTALPHLSACRLHHGPNPFLCFHAHFAPSRRGSTTQYLGRYQNSPFGVYQNTHLHHTPILRPAALMRRHATSWCVFQRCHSPPRRAGSTSTTSRYPPSAASLSASCPSGATRASSAPKSCSSSFTSARSPVAAATWSGGRETPRQLPYRSTCAPRLISVHTIVGLPASTAAVRGVVPAWSGMSGERIPVWLFAETSSVFLERIAVKNESMSCLCVRWAEVVKPGSPARRGASGKRVMGRSNPEDCDLSVSAHEVGLDPSSAVYAGAEASASVSLPMSRTKVGSDIMIKGRSRTRDIKKKIFWAILMLS